MNTYRFAGFESSRVYRNENATGVFLAVGVSGLRTFDQLVRQGDSAKAEELAERMIIAYPEYWQGTMSYADFFIRKGDSARGESIKQALHDTLVSFSASNPENLFYMQDLGLIRSEMGRERNDPDLIDTGLDLMWEAFALNPNNTWAFRKVITAMNQHGRFDRLQRAGEMHWKYKVNRNDPYLRQIMGATQQRAVPRGQPPG